MQVTSSATDPRTGRTITVSLDDGDGHRSFTDFGSLDPNIQFKKLSAKADSLVVYYLAREHIITPEQAKHRLAALREAME